MSIIQTAWETLLCVIAQDSFAFSTRCNLFWWLWQSLWLWLQCLQGASHCEAWASVPGMFCLCHRTYVYIYMVGLWMDVKTEAFTVYMIYVEFALCLMSFYVTQAWQWEKSNVCWLLAAPTPLESCTRMKEGSKRAIRFSTSNARKWLRLKWGDFFDPLKDILIYSVASDRALQPDLVVGRRPDG